MQQMREAFPWQEAPRYVLRDRDAIYGRDFADMTGGIGIEEVLTAPRSPWQNPFLERLVAPSDASAWTTLSCGMRGRCVVLCKAILLTKLSAVPYALSPGQRRPGAQGTGTARTGARGSDT